MSSNKEVKNTRFGLLVVFTFISCFYFQFDICLRLTLKVVSAIFLLVYFLRLKESTCETRENVFYFISKVLFVLEIIKF